MSGFYSARLGTPLGPLAAVCSEEGVAGLWFEGQRHFLCGFDALPPERPEHPVLLETAAWLKRYFDGGRPDPGLLPLAPQATPFQHLVLELLLEIPYGCTSSYGELARLAAGRLGRPTSPRAVGQAVGRNPISIVIPCHRVLGAGGTLTGYAGGLERKLWLLRHEGARV